VQDRLREPAPQPPRDRNERDERTGDSDGRDCALAAASRLKRDDRENQQQLGQKPPSAMRPQRRDVPDIVSSS